jgi:hypothetical protein
MEQRVGLGFNQGQDEGEEDDEEGTPPNGFSV